MLIFPVACPIVDQDEGCRCDRDASKDKQPLKKLRQQHGFNFNAERPEQIEKCMGRHRDDQAAIVFRQIAEQEPDTESIDPLDEISVINAEQERLYDIGRPEACPALSQVFHDQPP